MKRYLKVILLPVTLACILILADVIIEKKPTTQLTSCVSQAVIIHDNFRLNASFIFILGDKEGEISIRGIASENNTQYQVSRAIDFSYTKSGDIYRLVSQHIEYLSNEKKQKNEIDDKLPLPSFFHVPGISLTLTVKKDSYNNNIIYLYDIPVFYCALA